MTFLNFFKMKTTILKSIATLLVAVLMAAAAYAKISTPRIFSDNMILQRDMPVKIWGTADPNAMVNVDFGNQNVSVKSDGWGFWTATFAPMPACKTPRDIVISENGSVSKTIRDVLVGEVWVLGGQSNMEWTLSGSPKLLNDVKARADYPQIRYFRQYGLMDYSNGPKSDVNDSGKWLTLSKGANFGVCSAVGFLFAEILSKDLDMPVGLIQTAVGGTSMTAWISKNNFECSDYLKKFKADYNAAMAKYDYNKAIADWNSQNEAYKKACAEAKKAGKPAPEMPFKLRYCKPNPETCYDTFRSPSGHFNTKVAPLGKFGVRGVLWYQGEADAQGDSLKNFRSTFSAVVKSWRENFGKKDMPFFWVQLPSFNSNWGDVRMAQMLCLNDIKNGGMVCSIDTGEKNDIHPKDKAPVATRMANLVLQKVYGKNVNAVAPIVNRVEYEGNVADVYFNTFGKALVQKGDLKGFEIKVGGKWIKPQAELMGFRARLTLPKGTPANTIDGVRYLYAGWSAPDVSLFDTEGIPVAPFISDRANSTPVK